jgi:hypothetical protein
MTRIFESKAIYATLFLLFALALVVNTLAGGSLPTFGSDPFSAPQIQQRADGPVIPPDPWDTDKADKAS